jgi:hypothetical protein
MARLTPDDFMTLARTIEQPAARARQLMADSARRLLDAASHVPPPPVLGPLGERL